MQKCGWGLQQTSPVLVSLHIVISRSTHVFTSAAWDTVQYNGASVMHFVYVSVIPT